ncbi:MAG TPA: energy transducer TonB [Sphingomicrobium sp.]|nr:energy transducer TonB [Sphingomicrobium sp.]
MSYAQRKEISGNRTAAIVIVALIHALLGYAIVTGLAYNVIKKAAEDLKTFDVEEEPPPPEEEPPPPEDMPDLPPPPTQPPPIVRVQTPEPPIRIQESEAPPIPRPPTPVVTPPAPPRPPAPPPAVRSVPPRSASGNLQGLITGNDYPASAIDREEQGTVTVSLQIGTNGRVTGCSTTASSGSRTLDSTTCRILTSRARFTPARDSQGNPTTGTFSQRITWRLE